ncbi:MULTISPECIES: hypothetical protein [Pseudomonas]|jgi:antitoxin ParD1/3/4|uniref:hypothetical protein n=1 Tax=Pseudomonas TaxID=286 RepID=UPI000B0FAA48|nr:MULTISPECIES: hypothetical protein [Pseudomonas]WAB93302.1 hypothetical protein OSS47_04775 [Pseudomonas citronellolis]WRT85475.1 hypothetical protein VK748_13895 [Pseudomonas citronellolis]
MSTIDDQTNPHASDQRTQGRHRLRNLLLAGAESAPTEHADAAFFEHLRNRIKGQRKKP